MELNKDQHRVLKIPFASKKYINQFMKIGKNRNLYSYAGVAYYVFDEQLNVVYNTAKVTDIKNINDKISNAKHYIKNKEKKTEKELIFNVKNPNIGEINSYIEKYNVPVLTVVDRLTNSHSTGAGFGRGFYRTQIIYFDFHSEYNGWRFATQLANGKKSTDLETGYEYKYSKVKQNPRDNKISFKKLELLDDISISELMKKSSELNRLFSIYNQDMIPEKDIAKEYMLEIEYLISKKKYPQPLMRDKLIASLIHISPDDEKAEQKIIDNLTSGHRTGFRKNLLDLYLQESIKYENILNEHEITKVCEAAHILDVKFIIKEIKSRKLKTEQDLKELAKILKKISDVDNGIFMDPTTHTYFDKDLIIINLNGRLIDKTNTNKYKDKQLDLSKKQREYLLQRNLNRGNNQQL